MYINIRYYVSGYNNETKCFLLNDARFKIGKNKLANLFIK